MEDVHSKEVQKKLGNVDPLLSIREGQNKIDFATTEEESFEWIMVKNIEAATDEDIE